MSFSALALLQFIATGPVEMRSRLVKRMDWFKFHKFQFQKLMAAPKKVLNCHLTNCRHGHHVVIICHHGGTLHTF